MRLLKVNTPQAGPGDTGANYRRKPFPMYYIALFAAVISFMAAVAALDPALRRQTRIARQQRA